MSSQHYTPEFKDEAVRQVLERNYPGNLDRLTGNIPHVIKTYTK